MQNRSLRVLLIEHDEAVARAVSGMLEHAGDIVSAVIAVPSLESGLAELAQAHYNVVILEFFLPDGAGLANLSLLKKRAPLVPVIAVGATDDEAVAVEVVHAGAQDYLVRSQLSPRWLLRAIRYALERHEADMALLAAQEKYRGIFDHLVEGIFQSTPDGRYLFKEPPYHDSADDLFIPYRYDITVGAAHYTFHVRPGTDKHLLVIVSP